MMDRELLELAAKAATLRVHGWIDEKFYVVNIAPVDDYFDPYVWNPLHNDGDALRLAVKLGIAIQLHPSWVYARAVMPNDLMKWMEITEGWAHTADPYAATRRAIVRAAVAIGETP
jgi:hypothetical protein